MDRRLDDGASRTEDVASGVQRHPDTVDAARFAERHAFHTILPLPQAFTRNPHTTLGHEIMTTAPREMIAVRMRDNRARDGTPWIDMKITGVTVEAGFGDTKHWKNLLEASGCRSVCWMSQR